MAFNQNETLEHAQKIIQWGCLGLSSWCQKYYRNRLSLDQFSLSSFYVTFLYLFCIHVHVYNGEHININPLTPVPPVLTKIGIIYTHVKKTHNFDKKFQVLVG